ncbi:MAG: hydrolase [Parcubacteria group bacterium]|nr:hydrolase [Parcubacteria group bacterium]
MKERFKLIPEVFLLLIEDGKILLSRRFQTGYEDGNYGLPAGHGESGETMREGTAREAREEIGIEVKPEDLEFALTQHRWCPDPGNEHARVGYYFIPKNFTGIPHNAEPEKCDDLQFFSLDALPENMVPHVRAVIEAYKSREKYNEHNWETRA